MMDLKLSLISLGKKTSADNASPRPWPGSSLEPERRRLLSRSLNRLGEAMAGGCSRTPTGGRSGYCRSWHSCCHHPQTCGRWTGMACWPCLPLESRPLDSCRRTGYGAVCAWSESMCKLYIKICVNFTSKFVNSTLNYI